MRVDYGLFKGDQLLHKGILVIDKNENTEVLEDLRIRHHISGNNAKLIMEIFDDNDKLTKATLNMPIHESDDWESIELAEFTLAFKCVLNS